MNMSPEWHPVFEYYVNSDENPFSIPQSPVYSIYQADPSFYARNGEGGWTHTNETPYFETEVLDAIAVVEQEETCQIEAIQQMVSGPSLPPQTSDICWSCGEVVQSCEFAFFFCCDDCDVTWRSDNTPTTLALRGRGRVAWMAGEFGNFYVETDFMDLSQPGSLSCPA
jgi:hypothetical protein